MGKPIALDTVMRTLLLLFGVFFFLGCANEAGEAKGKVSFIPVVSGQHCPNTNELLSVLPADLDEVYSLTPIGQFSPPDHVFPAPHQYFYILHPDRPVDKHINVYAPANMTLTSIGLRHYNKIGKAVDYTDYTLVFSVCPEFEIYFHHLRTLEYEPFREAVKKADCSFSAQRNEDYCALQVNIPVEAGKVIATAGDINAGVFGFDLGARDYRLKRGKDFVNAQRHCMYNNVFDRCFAVCGTDYYPDSIREKIHYTGDNSRYSREGCGDIYGDKAGTAQGYWFKKGPKRESFSPESDFLFIGPDFIRPDVNILSVGDSVPGLIPMKYVSGLNFSLINDDAIRCLELQGDWHNDKAYVIIQMQNQSSLRVEKVKSCDAPVKFTGNYGEFER